MLRISRPLGLLVLLLAACTAGSGPMGSERPGVSVRVQTSEVPKRLVLAIISEPTGFNPAIETQRLGLASAGLAYHLFPGLSVIDHTGALRATVGAALPSVENGLWKVFPDGRMETTHPIRAGAAWHDGTPLTGDDLQFTITVLQDRDLSQFRMLGVNLIERVDARPDAAVVTWRQPFVDADSLFGTGVANSGRSVPLPRHILEEEYINNKSGFTELRYWSDEFVGIGPYRLKEWTRGSHLVLGAFEGYPLGRPRIDEIEVRFIPDGNTLIANMLSGALDMPHGSVVGIDQALVVKEQWPGGTVVMDPAGWVVAYPQSIDPQPAIIGNVQFRRALMHAVDRQQLVDTLMRGLLPVADSVLTPGTPEYQATESSVVRYEYDPRRAMSMLEELGYTRGSGGVLQDANGQPLQVEARAYAQRDIHQKTLFPLVDFWKQVGVGAEAVGLPSERARDAREQATFPGFLVLRQPNGLARMVALHSAQARTAERNYQGTNNGRYQSPELDSLIDRYQTTIPMPERMRLAGQIVRHFGEQLPVLPLFYDALPIFVNNRVLNVHPHSNLAWNVHEWDLKP